MDEMAMVWGALVARGYTVRVEAGSFAGGGLLTIAEKDNGKKQFCIRLDDGRGVYRDESSTKINFEWYDKNDAETLLQFVERMINQ